MEFLLDTHIIMWMLFYPEKVPQKAVPILSNSDNKFYYSVASIWETSIKHRKHPQAMEHTGVELMHLCEEMGFRKLEIDARHIVALETLAQREGTASHEDPFDRILLAQAKGDGMTLITHDRKFLAYDEPYLFVV